MLYTCRCEPEGRTELAALFVSSLQSLNQSIQMAFELQQINSVTVLFFFLTSANDGSGDLPSSVERLRL